MPESLASLKKISAAVLEDFKKAIAAQADFVAKTKATPAAETGTFKVIILTSDEDRQGDSTDQSKWNLKNFEANSVVLWAHDYYSLPVGIATKIGVQNGSSSQNESLHRPSSIRSRAKCPNSTKRVLSRQLPSVICNTRRLTRTVGVQLRSGPSNPYALSMREIKALKLNLPELVMKGLQFITKAESAGDACTMTDGSAGVLAEDPDNAGQLICVPAEKTQKEREAPNDPELDNSQAQVWRSKTARFCSQDCYLSHEKQRLGL